MEAEVGWFWIYSLYVWICLSH